MPTIFGSSMIAAADYDADTQQLIVTFSRGNRYSYAGVPPQVAESLFHQPSAGTYFLSDIKPYYQATKIG